MKPVITRVAGCGIAAVLMSASANLMAEAYRSKVYLDPANKISEAAELSIEQLEQQLGSLSDDYARASAGRHLARHYLQQKQYQKAIDFYRGALDASGLSAVANQQMVKELASVYLLQGDAPEALRLLRALHQQLPEPDVEFWLLLGRAQFKSGDYLGLADTLEALINVKQSLEYDQLKQLLALAYGARNYSASEAILKLLIDQRPSDLTTWRQLTSIYLTQSKHKAALDNLALAYDKRLPFSEDDLLLLANLYASNKAPQKGAQLLQHSLEIKALSGSGQHYQKLFEYWLVAREKDRAIAALARAAKLSGDMELGLKLAQLYMEQSDWQQMQTTVMHLCRKTLPDKYVGRTNLLLGISELKLGRENEARRALINATLMGSQWQKANQWLGFMQAQPASASEMRSLEGPCLPQDADVRVVEDAVLQAAQVPAVSRDRPVLAGAFNVPAKVVKGRRFYRTKTKIERDNVGAKLRSMMVPLGVSLVRSGGAIDGKLHIFFKGDAIIQSDTVKVLAGFPIKGNPPSKGRYKTEKLSDFKCVYREYQGDPQGLRDAWEQLFREALQAGYELTGEGRQIIDASNSGEQLRMELQLGVL